jgi:uncharacterized RDD family membrane protein YckC
MEESNIYAAPQAEVLDDSNGNFNLASRSQRFWGALVDGLIVMSVTLPIAYFTGGFEVGEGGVEPDYIRSAIMSFVGFAFFLGINYKFLKNDGQTIGKKIAKTKIVTNDGFPASFGGHILKRYAFYNFISIVPIVGIVLGLISDLIIFGSAKRCGHDYFGGTKVVAI